MKVEKATVGADGSRPYIPSIPYKGSSMHPVQGYIIIIMVREKKVRH